MSRPPRSKPLFNMSKLSQCHEPGLLLVSTRPRSSHYLCEFHHWYNTEHGPARLKLDFVENGYRYQPIDDSTIWTAMYDLNRVSATAEPQYTALRRHRSSREQDVLQNKVDILERKIYKHVSTRGCSRDPAPVITCVSFVVQRDDVDEVDRWYEEQHIEDLSRIPGWRRSRRFQLVDGNLAPDHIELFALHEFDQENGLGGPEHMRARHRPWREKIVRLAKSRVNREFRFVHRFKAEDYSVPPETLVNAYVRGQDISSIRRSSLATGHEYAINSPTHVGLHQALLPHVH